MNNMYEGGSMTLFLSPCSLTLLIPPPSCSEQTSCSDKDLKSDRESFQNPEPTITPAENRQGGVTPAMGERENQKENRMFLW